MYTERMLRRYETQIEDRDQQQQFKNVVDSIQFDEDGYCPGSALNLFEGTAVKELADDFRKHYLWFMSEEDRRIA